MFVLRFYHPDKTDKINRLIHDSGSKDKLSCQNADVCIKIVSSTAGNIHSFPQKKKKNASDHLSKVSGFGYDPKNPPPLWIIWINIPFFYFRKEKK